MTSTPEQEVEEEAPERAELRRRELLALLGASAALGGLDGCNQSPREKLLSYVRAPTGLEPGVPVEYATTMTLGGFGTGLIGLVQDGRPIKLDGNPDHPASLGGSSIYHQGAILDLYDPARLRQPRHGGAPASWHAASTALRTAGPRTWIVLPPQTSPLVEHLIDEISYRLPSARICFYSPLSRGAVYEGSRRAFGRSVETRPDFSRAQTVLALDCDFVSGASCPLSQARDFARRRRLAAPNDPMTRLYVAEAMLTPTGSLADHRLAIPSQQVKQLASAVLRELYRLGRSVPGLPQGVWRSSAPEPLEAFARAVARDLDSGPGFVLVGERQPVETHLLGHAINAALGSLGNLVQFNASPQLPSDASGSLENLAAALQEDAVDTLVILEEDLVYSAPPQLALVSLIPKARERFHLTSCENATSRLCDWQLPLAHFLEAWGDARAIDGTRSYAQPLIEPLYSAKSSAEVLAMLAGRSNASGYELLAGLYRAQLGGRRITEWQRQLSIGVVASSTWPNVDVHLRAGPVIEAVRRAESAALGENALELDFTLGNLHDGRYANNAWLLELPHPMTKQSWGNAAVLSPATAQRLNVESGQILAISAGGRTLRVPALVLPGHADQAISIDVGYGSDGVGLGRGLGVNAYALRSDADTHFRVDAHVAATGERVALAITQEHSRAPGRDTVLTATLDEYRQKPQLAPRHASRRSLLPPVPQAGTQWSMSIDTMICSGCSACVIACQAENNVPVVGKEQVMKSREMYWLRIDRYFTGDPAQPKVVSQPMLCQHCEKAPCEYVCPVNATVHSPDGLNEMVYNRCIGTRFCSNNCPYKVRRFNWFDYAASSGTELLQKNPEVTVRERGVMEKCSFCVQRIRRAEQRALAEKRPLGPTEVVTACQAACPTQAIQFGSLHGGESPMLSWRLEGRSYAALDELGTEPRVRYLAKIDNPSPELTR